MNQGKRVATQQTGQEAGRSLLFCLGVGRCYSRTMGGLLPHLYIAPLFLAYLVLDISLRYAYRDMGIVGVSYLPACLFTLGWAALLCGLVFCLPRVLRRLLLWLPMVLFVALAVVHSGFMSAFRKMFSFSFLGYYGGAMEFMDASYVHIDPLVVAGCVVALFLTFTAGRMLTVLPPQRGKLPALLGLLALCGGVALVALVHVHYFPVVDTVVWESDGDAAQRTAYHEFSDTTNSLLVCGLYHYTARDLWLQLFPGDSLSQEEIDQIEDYIAEYEETKTENDYTGLLAGKNVILIQMEAIDTWMLEGYMPNAARLKAEGISFSNHYSPAYISAGTFNTEFIVNSGLLPATGGISTTVYSGNSFPYSLASLFTQAGYTARSFHNSEGNVYDRLTIHQTLGYEKYYGGSDLNMESHEFDTQLLNGFAEMTEGEPFFSFIITYSAHGAYSESNVIYQAHAEEARAAATSSEGYYVYAVAGAMETDAFIGDLVDALEEADLLDDTVLIFYADHYNYYMMNDELNMQIKGVENLNLLQQTDFFIWSADLTPTVVEKVTSSADVLPTLANLFGLDTTGAFLTGHDAFGEAGGYVFFSDGSWYDGTTYWSSSGGEEGDAARTAEITRIKTLSNWVLSGNYYALRE